MSNLRWEEDPLHEYSGLALFPRTLRSLSIPLPSPLYNSHDLQHTHNLLLSSMPFEVNKELEEEAKAILAESLNQEIQTHSTISSGKSLEVAVGVAAGGSKWKNGVRRSVRIKNQILKKLKH